MAQERQPVIVVGGGIGGLAAALALARKGFPVRVLEQAPEFREIGAGIQMSPNVFKMFDRLGLTERIRRIAWFPDRLVLMDCIEGKEVTRITLGTDFFEKFKQPYAVIHRADLHQAILEACRDCGTIALETSRKVTAVEDRAGGVAATLADGTRVDGAALIGADGLWSTVRRYIVDDGNPRVSGHIAYRAVLATEDVPERLRVGSMVIWAGEKTHLVHYPLRSGEITNLVAVFHSNRYEEGWDSYGDPAELHQRFAGTCEEVRTMLGKIEEWRMWVLCDREPLKDWSRGLISLLGDAAHPMMQYLAQG
ncbi:MAG: FAD-dependent monooxygenase, partial [Stellaceae bacterium]